MPVWFWIIIVWIVYMVFIMAKRAADYKKAKEESRKFQQSLKVGDRVILTNGIHGSISLLDKATAIIKIADRVEITVERYSIGTFE